MSRQKWGDLLDTLERDRQHGVLYFEIAHPPELYVHRILISRQSIEWANLVVVAVGKLLDAVDDIERKTSIEKEFRALRKAYSLYDEGEEVEG